jgi:hypothetical protein
MWVSKRATVTPLCQRRRTRNVVGDPVDQPQVADRSHEQQGRSDRLARREDAVDINSRRPPAVDEADSPAAAILPRRAIRNSSAQPRPINQALDDREEMLEPVGINADVTRSGASMLTLNVEDLGDLLL